MHTVLPLSGRNHGNNQSTVAQWRKKLITS